MEGRRHHNIHLPYAVVVVAGLRNVEAENVAVAEASIAAAVVAVDKAAHQAEVDWTLPVSFVCSSVPPVFLKQRSPFSYQCFSKATIENLCNSFDNEQVTSNSRWPAPSYPNLTRPGRRLKSESRYNEEATASKIQSGKSRKGNGE